MCVLATVWCGDQRRCWGHRPPPCGPRGQTQALMFMQQALYPRVHLTSPLLLSKACYWCTVPQPPRFPLSLGILYLMGVFDFDEEFAWYHPGFLSFFLIHHKLPILFWRLSPDCHLTTQVALRRTVSSYCHWPF